MAKEYLLKKDESFFTKIEQLHSKIDVLLEAGERKLKKLKNEAKYIKLDATIKVDAQKPLLEKLQQEITKTSSYIQEHKPELESLQEELVKLVKENYDDEILSLKAPLENKYKEYETKLSIVKKEAEAKIKQLRTKLNLLVKENAKKIEEETLTLKNDLKQTKDLQDKIQIQEKISATYRKYIEQREAKSIEILDEINSIKEETQTLTEKMFLEKTADYSKYISLLLEKHDILAKGFANPFDSSEVKAVLKQLKAYNSIALKGYFVKGDFEEVNKKMLDELDKLRTSGVTKVENAKQAIVEIKKSKDLGDDDKAVQTLEQIKLIDEGKQFHKLNKHLIDKLVCEGVGYVKVAGKKDVLQVKHESEVSNIKAKNIAKCNLQEEKVNRLKREKHISDTIVEVESNPHKETIIKNIKKSFQVENKSSVKEIKDTKNRILKGTKRNNHEAFLHDQSLMTNYRNGKPSIGQKVVQKIHNIAYNFSLKNFLLNNAIYIIIICFFIGAVIKNSRLLSTDTIMNILSNASIRVFFSLGVAGLILLAGTDLSIGRMIGLGTVLTTMMLQTQGNSYSIFGIVIDNSSWNIWGRVILAFIITTFATTLFSSIAGFFTAKFKMHPFISTLGTQLIIYGLLAFGTDGKSTTSIDKTAQQLIKFGTKYYLGLIIFAILAIFIVWFIWNKTKFGRNLYAVGGNAEAASVSGISVFKITLLAFVMAGILYGFGSFFDGIKTTTSSATYGNGYELDAIAACVVGGISFSGGIGKIGGVVFGTVLFEMLSTSFTYLRIDTNMAFVVKGLIILVAVTLDSIKYLKKK